MRTILAAVLIGHLTAVTAFAQGIGTELGGGWRSYNSTATIPGGAPGGSPGSVADPNQQCPIKTFTGHVIATNRVHKTLTVTGPHGKPVTFTLALTTAIHGPTGEPMVLEDLEPGSLVKVSYTGPEEAPASLICIDVPPGPGQ